MLNQDKQVGGEPVHVRDSYVWAEIFYLDSATDYRECLPQKPVPQPTFSETDLVMLDRQREWSSSDSQGILAIAGVFFMITGLLLGFILYWLA